MLQSFLSSLRASASNDSSTSTRRRHARRDTDQCVAVVCGQTFPVENWSFGGVLLMGDDRLFGNGQDLDVTMKYKLNSAILDVPLRGKVIRKNSLRIAVEFDATTNTVQRYFMQVVDDSVAREFANSQV